MVNLSQNILTTDEQCSIRCVPPGVGVSAIVASELKEGSTFFTLKSKVFYKNLLFVKRIAFCQRGQIIWQHGQHSVNADK